MNTVEIMGIPNKALIIINAKAGCCNFNCCSFVISPLLNLSVETLLMIIPIIKKNKIAKLENIAVRLETFPISLTILTIN